MLTRVHTHSHTSSKVPLRSRNIIIIIIIVFDKAYAKGKCACDMMRILFEFFEVFFPFCASFLAMAKQNHSSDWQSFHLYSIFFCFFFCVRCQRRHTKARHSMVLSSFLFLQTNSSVVIHIWLSNRLCKTIWRNSKKWMLAPDNLINCSEKCWHSWLSIDRRWWLEFNKRFPLTIYVATLPLTRRVRQVLFNNTPMRSYTHTTNWRPN